MNSSKKNTARMVIVIFFLLVAAAISFFLLPNIYKLEGATTEVVMLRQDVTVGQIIDENMVATVEVGAYGLDSSVVRNPEDIIGMYAAQNIKSVELLYGSKFTNINPLADEGEASTEIPVLDNQMLVSLQVPSIAAAGAGSIMPGDKVNTAVYIAEANGSVYYGEEEEDEEDGSNVIFPEQLQNLTVYRVKTAQLTSVNPNGDPNSSTNTRIPAYITLLCTQEQAELLLDYSYTNSVHFIEVE